MAFWELSMPMSHPWDIQPVIDWYVSELARSDGYHPLISYTRQSLSRGN